MASSVQHQVHAHSEKLRGELEIIRGEALKLQGEARLQVDQHMNTLKDRIEGLERKADKMSDDADDSDLETAAKKAWEDISTGIENAAKDVRRELDKRT
jgi:DNA uptake protein ComE-like DNA-binding protein